MAVVSASVKDWAELYDGFDKQLIGIGLSNPNIYADDRYAKKKQGQIVLGGLASMVYSGFDHDPMPLALTFAYEPQYNTIMAFNLHYVPQIYRQAILKMVVDMNVNNIKKNKPIVVDYKKIVKKIPQAEAIIRRYKLTGIRVLGNIPIAEWGKATKERSPFSNMYKARRR